MTGLAAAELARAAIGRFGGRYSIELGIDVDSGDAEVEGWFVASTLIGTRNSAGVAERAYAQLERAGIRRITDAGSRQRQELVTLLDAGGYARYDYRTATRLQLLAQVVRERYEGSISEIGRRCTSPAALAAALEALPGWGPVSTGLFLRELHGCGPPPNCPWTHERPRRRATWAFSPDRPVTSWGASLSSPERRIATRVTSRPAWSGWTWTTGAWRIAPGTLPASPDTPAAGWL